MVTPDRILGKGKRWSRIPKEAVTAPELREQLDNAHGGIWGCGIVLAGPGVGSLGILSRILGALGSSQQNQHSGEAFPKTLERLGLENEGSPIPAERRGIAAMSTPPSEVGAAPRRDVPDKARPQHPERFHGDRDAGNRETGRALRDTSRASLGSNTGIAANPGLGSLPESTWSPGFSGQLLPLFTALVYSRLSLELHRPSTEGVPRPPRSAPCSAINPTLHIPLSPELREYSRPLH